MNLKKFFIVVLAIAGISAGSLNQDKLYDISKNIEIFINVFKELNANYVDDLDPNQLMRVGIDAMVGSLDPYTNYISESQVASYMINTEGKYEGIGAIVEEIDGMITIVEPYEGSPVLEAGLKAGDQIIAIEGQSTKGKTREEVSAFYRGIPGTDVRLRIRSVDGTEKEVDIKRSEVNIPNVPYSGFVDDNIGYIALTTFTPDAGKNITKAYRKLKNENVNIQGLILDLRNNGGGLLREAISISNIFIPKDKEVVSVKSKVKERDESYKTTQEPVNTEIPVVVLINKNSASASEIVSGVLQDYDRAVLMGQRSYGKGLVQNTKEVGYNSRIKLTTSKYYIPSGRCIQSVMYENGEPVDIPDEKRSRFKTSKGRVVLDGGGVTPDVVLEIPEEAEILKALKEQYIIFKFANQYVNQVDTSAIDQGVVFTDFDQFSQFVDGMNFSYQTIAEKKIEELEDRFDEDDSAILMEIDALKDKVQGAKETALLDSKQAIINEIEIELATRINNQTGKVYQRLHNDAEVDSAVALLKDRERYLSILNPS